MGVYYCWLLCFQDSEKIYSEDQIYCPAPRYCIEHEYCIRR
jgi:hypothetical protein